MLKKIQQDNPVISNLENLNLHQEIENEEVVKI